VVPTATARWTWRVWVVLLRLEKVEGICVATCTELVEL